MTVDRFAREREIRDAIETLEHAIEIVGGATDQTNRMMQKLKEELEQEIKKNSSTAQG